MTSTAYLYDPTTKEFLNQSITAGPDPLQPGKFLYPMYTTHVSPPLIPEGFVAIWQETDWQVVKDDRGTWYDTLTKIRHEITDPGVEPADTWTQIPPSDPDAKWTGDAWEIPLEILRQRQIDAIRRAADSHLHQISDKYSETEQATWTRQQTGAEELLQDINADSEEAALVRNLAVTRGLDISELSTRILDNARNYAAEADQLLIDQKALEQQVLVAQSVDDLNKAATGILSLSAPYIHG